MVSLMHRFHPGALLRLPHRLRCAGVAALLAAILMVMVPGTAAVAQPAVPVGGYAGTVFTDLEEYVSRFNRDSLGLFIFLEDSGAAYRREDLERILAANRPADTSASLVTALSSDVASGTFGARVPSSRLASSSAGTVAAYLNSRPAYIRVGGQVFSRQSLAEVNPGGRPPSGVLEGGFGAVKRYDQTSDSFTEFLADSELTSQSHVLLCVSNCGAANADYRLYDARKLRASIFGSSVDRNDNAALLSAFGPAGSDPAAAGLLGNVEDQADGTTLQDYLRTQQELGVVRIGSDYYHRRDLDRLLGNLPTDATELMELLDNLKIPVHADLDAYYEDADRGRSTRSVVVINGQLIDVPALEKAIEEANSPSLAALTTVDEATIRQELLDRLREQGAEVASNERLLKEVEDAVKRLTGVNLREVTELDRMIGDPTDQNNPDPDGNLYQQLGQINEDLGLKNDQVLDTNGDGDVSREEFDDSTVHGQANHLFDQVGDPQDETIDEDGNLQQKLNDQRDKDAKLASSFTNAVGLSYTIEDDGRVTFSGRDTDDSRGGNLQERINAGQNTETAIRNIHSVLTGLISYTVNNDGTITKSDRTAYNNIEARLWHRGGDHPELNPSSGNLRDPSAGPTSLSSGLKYIRNNEEEVQEKVGEALIGVSYTINDDGTITHTDAVIRQEQGYGSGAITGLRSTDIDSGAGGSGKAGTMQERINYILNFQDELPSAIFAESVGLAYNIESTGALSGTQRTRMRDRDGKLFERANAQLDFDNNLRPEVERYLGVGYDIDDEGQVTLASQDEDRQRAAWCASGDAGCTEEREIANLREQINYVNAILVGPNPVPQRTLEYANMADFSANAERSRGLYYVVIEGQLHRRDSLRLDPMSEDNLRRTSVIGEVDRHDAQIFEFFEQLEENKRSIAAAAALHSTYVEPWRNYSLDVVASSYDGENALALGLGMRLGDQWQASLSSATDMDFEQNSVRVSLNYRW